ncbi:MAG: thioredoxin-disulfide reductase [Ignavibacteriales bacterium]
MPGVGKTHDVVVVGGGPAGLTAGIYASRSGLGTVILEKMAPGGQAATTFAIENYPGFPGGVDGPGLMAAMEEQARRFGTEIVLDEAVSVRAQAGDYVIDTTGGQVRSRTVIIATGTRERPLGVPGETELRGRGVSYCATCDGAFFKDKKVAVVGGGDSAITEALFLSRVASMVTVVHRRDALRANKHLQDRAFSNQRISFAWNSVVTAIEGKDRVEGIRLRDVKSGETTLIEADGVFVYVGFLPNTAFLTGVVNLDASGYVITDNMLRTSAPGIFAAGDARVKELRQVVTAAADGAVAAVSAERYLMGVS